MRTRTLVLMMALTLAAAAPAAAATFVVNNNGNSSDSSVGNGVCRTSGNVCTLRAAIQEANATPGVDTITFAIGSGDQRITISSSLPNITTPIIIDGATQPGFTGKPLIEIRGSNGTDYGFRITGGTGTVLRSLIINNFDKDGIFISGPGGNVVEGCYIGLNAAGTAASGNGETGVRMESPDNRIGGKLIAQRNVVSGNRGRSYLGAVFMYGANATRNIVQGNFIGLDAAGLIAIGNEARGVAMHDAPGNYVGGVEAGAGNLIAGNRATGVRMWGAADGNYVLGNWIGVNRNKETRIGRYDDDPTTLSNARGVQMRSDDNVVAYNYIAGNTYDGVLFYDGTNKDYNPDATASRNLVYANVITKNGMNPPGPDGPGSGIGMFIGTGNKLIYNSIYDNATYGINLANIDYDGIDANDLFDTDTGTNNRQNYPILTVLVVGATNTRVGGYLHSTPNAPFSILLHANPDCNPSGHGEGLYPLGGISVTTDADGNAIIDATLDVVLPDGWVMTALAMSESGDTSEFSNCVRR